MQDKQVEVMVAMVSVHNSLPLLRPPHSPASPGPSNNTTMILVYCSTLSWLLANTPAANVILCYNRLKHDIILLSGTPE